MVSLSLGLFGISIAVVQGLLIRQMIKRLGERRLLVFGMSFNLLVFVLLAFLTSGTWALILTPFTAMGAVVVPTLQGLIAKMGDDNQQGEIQGIVSSVRSIAVIVAPMIMTTIFFAATRPDGAVYFPGAPFLLSAGFVALCLGIFLSRPKGSLSKTS